MTNGNRFEIRVEVDGNGRRAVAEVWSDARLPFEPKAWLADLRSAIADAVSSLTATPGELLHCTYVSAIDDRCDAENILFYNVGTKPFSAAARFGLVFERCFGQPPPAPSGAARPHYHRYAIAPLSEPLTHWVPRRPLAEWNALVPTVKDPAAIWYAAKSSLSAIEPSATEAPARFGLDITVTVAFGKSVAVVAACKPILDGVISAMHYANAPSSAIIERLVARVGSPPDAVRAALSNPTGALLGQRALVSRRGDGIQWNPADDRCVACRIIVERGSSSLWNLQGVVTSVDPRSAP